MNESILESLLYQEESATLDFKVQQRRSLLGSARGRHALPSLEGTIVSRTFRYSASGASFWLIFVVSSPAYVKRYSSGEHEANSVGVSPEETRANSCHRACLG